MTTSAALGIDLVQLVTIPTTDQSRSLSVLQSLGFEVRAKFPWADGHRWIEVYPPGTSTGLALVPAGRIRLASARESSSTRATSMPPINA